MPPSSLTLGPFTVYYYSLFILIGIALGYQLAAREAKRIKFDLALLRTSLWYGVIPGIIGARLYHVIDYAAVYRTDPLAVLAIWSGGLGILGGLLGGALGLWYFAWRYRVRLLSLLDLWAPSVLLAQAIGRLGNWTNQEAFGPPTDLPWGVYIDPAHRPLEYASATHFHPTFFYEMGIDLIGLAILLALRPRLRRRPGAILGAYLIIYAIGRFAVEFFRFDTAQVLGISAAQLIAVLLAGVGSWLVFRRAGQTRKS